MNSVNIVKRQRLKSDKEFYVYYNEWTGEIISTGCSLRTNTKFPFIKTTDMLAERILQGHINHKKYMVSFDDATDKMGIVKKDNVLRLRKQEDNLFLIPDTRLDKWDIRAKFYTANNKMTVELNPDSIRQLTNFNIKADLKIEDSRNLNLFVVRKNQPDLLVETLEIDPRDLIEHDVLSIDVSSIVKHISYDEISLLTRRNFEHYYCEVIHSKYLPKLGSTSRVRGNKIYVAKDYPDSHISFEQVDGHLLVSTTISAEQFSDFGFHKSTETFYVVGDTPDKLIDTIEVDMLQLRQGCVEHFALEDNDIDKFNIVHCNDKIRVAKRKIA